MYAHPLESRSMAARTLFMPTTMTDFKELLRIADALAARGCYYAFGLAYENRTDLWELETFRARARANGQTTVDLGGDTRHQGWQRRFSSLLDLAVAALPQAARDFVRLGRMIGIAR